MARIRPSIVTPRGAADAVPTISSSAPITSVAVRFIAVPPRGDVRAANRHPTHGGLAASNGREWSIPVSSLLPTLDYFRPTLPASTTGDQRVVSALSAGAAAVESVPVLSGARCSTVHTRVGTVPGRKGTRIGCGHPARASPPLQGSIQAKIGR